MWRADDIIKIVETDHMGLLVFAHTHGCPWNTGACKEAAYIGWLEALQYAHENGCTWDWSACMDAAMRRRVGRRCRPYLKEHQLCASDGTCRFKSV